MDPIKARDLMNTKLCTVRAELTLAELAEYLNEEDIHGAPVVDRDGHLVGVVSRTDAIRALGELHEDEDEIPQTYWQRLVEGSNLPAEAEDTRVRDIMSEKAVTIDDVATVGDVAQLMLTEGISRVIVRNNEGIQGIISATDLLAALVEYEKDLG